MNLQPLAAVMLAALLCGTSQLNAQVGKTHSLQKVSNYSSFLRHPQIQEEIKFTAEQKEKFQRAETEFRNTLSNAVPRNRKDQEQYRAKVKEVYMVFGQQIDDILTDDQKTRIDQILFQRHGVHGLRMSEYQAKLGLSKEQSESMNKFFSDGFAKMRKLTSESNRTKPFDAEKHRQKSLELRRQIEKEVFDVLTDEQKTKFKELSGEPFKWKHQTTTIVPARPASIDDRATHKQVGLIRPRSEENPIGSLNAFCVSSDGDILAACGEGPGQVVRMNNEGKVLQMWEIPVKAEAVNTAPNGTILVAGQGKIYRFSNDGTQLKEAAAPHARNLENVRQKMAEDYKQRFERQVDPTEAYNRQIAHFEARLKDLQEKEEPTDEERQMIEAFSKALEQLVKAKARIANLQQQNSSKATQEQVDRYVDQMMRRKTAVASISSDGKATYVATAAMEGYGYVVWRMTNEFADAEVIVKDLRGCCGQMDVQCSSNGLYVAENSRHRVVNYDVDGKLIKAWGKKDRTGQDGFTSCCNPMNVCFGTNGDVYTAESNSGRVKRFSRTGDFISFVGDVKLVPGCKKVSIGVSPDGESVYMLDITRNHIVWMKKKDGMDDDGNKTTAAKN